MDLDARTRREVTRRLNNDKFFLMSDTDIRNIWDKALGQGFKIGIVAGLAICAIAKGIMLLIT